MSDRGTIHPGGRRGPNHGSRRTHTRSGALAWEPMRVRLTTALDSFVRPELRVFNRVCPAFGVCTYLGLGVGAALAMIMAAAVGLSLAAMGAIVAIAILASAGFGLATKALIGSERFTFYHYGILVLVVSAAAAWILNQPVLAFLDIVVISLAVTQIVVRTGCLMAGCCHGRPHRWGVRYGHAHADSGFPHALVGVRLLPVQAIESLWLLVIVLIAAASVVRDASPGEVFAFYVIAYGAGRFVLEFMRGDRDRLYFMGFSEAQWTSIAVMLLAVGLAWRGLLPLHFWQIAMTAAILSLTIVVALQRRFSRTSRYDLLHADHVNEVAEILDQVTRPPVGHLPHATAESHEVLIGRTSRGICISAGRYGAPSGYDHHYSLSSANSPMAAAAAATVAQLILRLRHPYACSKLVRGNHDVFHLLVCSPSHTAPAGR